MKVLHTYRVLLHFRTPVYRRLAAWPGIEFLAIHGADFPGTKTVNADDLSGFAHRRIATWRLVSRVTGEREITIPLWPTLPFHLARERPDVIFAEGAGNLVNDLVIMAWGRLTGTPVVWWTLGEVDHPGPLAWYQRLFRWIVTALDRRAAAVVGYSSQTLAYLERIGVPPDRRFRAVNCVDTDQVFADIDALGDEPRALRARLGLEGKQVLLFVGSLAPYKRVEDLIAVFDRLRSAHPDARLVIVGGGPHREFLEQFAAERGVDGVTFTGPVLDGVAPYFQMADLFVLPGLGGLALSEALAHGLPLVATLADGTERDLIEEGRNGHILPVGDRERMTVCLDALLRDPETRRRMGEHSRSLARERYNIHTFMENLVAALHFAHTGQRELPEPVERDAGGNA